VIGAAHLMMRAAGVSQPTGLFAWGVNSYGQLGLGDRTFRSSPVQVGSLTDWSTAAGTLSGDGNQGAGAFFAIKTDGTFWSWGDNDQGELGLGDVTRRSSPTQIGSGANWAQIAAGSVGQGGAVIGAITTAGTLWTWGSYGAGPSTATASMFGRGPIGYTDFSSPVQVGADNTWSKIAACHNNMIAIKTNGALWAWGMNDGGQLGLGDRTLRSSPVQVGTDTNWSKIVGSACAVTSGYFLAIKTDGTLWAWGTNLGGELGLGDRTLRSSPVQVGSDTDWAQIGASAGASFAIKTGGTLWSWGASTYGAVGRGDQSSSSPVQVGAATDWSKVSGSLYSAVAIKTNGTLWAWGYNGDGELGLGDRTHRSSPVQVGSGTNWAALAQNCGLEMAAIRA